MPCDVVLVQPPFAPVDSPSLALSTLQAALLDAGIDTRVVYANLAFAERIGVFKDRRSHFDGVIRKRKGQIVRQVIVLREHAGDTNPCFQIDIGQHGKRDRRIMPDFRSRGTSRIGNKILGQSKQRISARISRLGALAAGSRG